MHPQRDGAVEIRQRTTHAAWGAGPLGSGALDWVGGGVRGVAATVAAGGLGGGGRPHASYALEWEGRDTIWLNGLFRGFAVYNVLAGKVAIG